MGATSVSENVAVSAAKGHFPIHFSDVEERISDFLKIYRAEGSSSR